MIIEEEKEQDLAPVENLSKVDEQDDHAEPQNLHDAENRLNGFDLKFLEDNNI